MKNFIIKKHKSKIFGILGFSLILVIWIFLSNKFVIVPGIKDVLIRLFDILKTSRIYKLLFKMIAHILITLGLSFIIALLLSSLSYISKGFLSFINPIITLLKTIPIVAIIIVLFLSIGTKNAPYVATSFVLIPMIYENLLSGLQLIDDTITDDIRTLSNINVKIIFKFYIPYILPTILTSLIQSFGLGLKVMLMTEYMSPSRETFGAEIRRYYENIDMESVYAIIIIVLILVFTTDITLKFLKRKVKN